MLRQWSSQFTDYEHTDNNLQRSSINQSINWFIRMAAQKLDWNMHTTRIITQLHNYIEMNTVINTVIIMLMNVHSFVHSFSKQYNTEQFW